MVGPLGASVKIQSDDTKEYVWRVRQAKGSQLLNKPENLGD
jgi:hypothetical protein